MDMRGIKVKISVANARQLFKGCSVDYIRNVCKGRCCEGTSGISVAVHELERTHIESLGGVVKDGMLLADERGLCPFKANDGLCRIHDQGKPLGCIASPFTFNHNNTLIVRNRYRRLGCYRGGTIPAYKAFSTSLVALFGNTGVIDRLSIEVSDFWVMMPYDNYQILTGNTNARKRGNNEGQAIRQIPQELPLF